MPVPPTVIPQLKEYGPLDPEPIEFERTIPAFFHDGSDHTFVCHLTWSDYDRRTGQATDADLIAALNAMSPERRSAILSAVGVGF